MKNQKRLVIVMAVAFIFSSLAGCSKASSKEDLPETTMLTEESVVYNLDTTELDESETTTETTEETTTEESTTETTVEETTENTVTPTETTAGPTAIPTAIPTTSPGGETSYVCPICGDSFGELSLYNSHINSAHVTPTPVPTSTPRPTTAPTATPTPTYTQTRVRTERTEINRWSNSEIALANEYGVTLPYITITYVRYEYSDGRIEYDYSGSGYSDIYAFVDAVESLSFTVNGETYYCTNYGGTGVASSRTEALINGSWQPI